MWWSKGKSRVIQDARPSAAPMIMSLEPRMLFDGAVAATVADAAQADSHPTADAAKAPSADHTVVSKDTQSQADATTATTPAAAASPVAVPGQSVVFVDSRVKDPDSLLKGVAAGTLVVQLDGSKDGLQQIADYLDSHQGVSTVEIVAHGNAGDLWLGSTYLSADNISARSAVLAQIGKDMNVGGDILIYACYTAEGDSGLSFVDSIADLTGRDVAASNNRTGVGGDWDLEITTGTIESVNALSTASMSAYQWGLATWTATNNLDSGTGSLRAELALAQNGDIVTFSTGMTVGLNTELLINKNITIDGDLNNDGVADVTLSGQYKTRVVEVAAGSTVKLDGLVITKGLVAGNGGNAGYAAAAAMGGGIFNAGTLTLDNVTVTANAASGGGGGGGVTASAVGGGGGGGGGIGGGIGGHGGTAGSGTGSYAGGAGSANAGGYGGSFTQAYLSGRGGTSTGGSGATASYGYTAGGNGGSASNGTLAIGGGGGGSGWDKSGGTGANAAGGIYNASTGILTVIGTSVISNNIAAGGGGGGGGSSAYGQTGAGGSGGGAVGGIWNRGTLQITSANVIAITGNAAASGSGGSGLSTGPTPLAVANVFNDGGTVNANYIDPPTATIVVANQTLSIGQASQVTITFSAAVSGFTNSDLTIPNGTLTAVSSSDGGVTWTATLTPSTAITDTTNVITLDNTGVTTVSNGVAGTGSSVSNNYVVDTVRPTATIVLADNALKIGDTSLVTITFSEAVTGFTNADLSIANGTLTAVSSSDGGITWTASFTPTANVTSATNAITLNNTGVSDTAGNAGAGSTDSNNYAIDTARPTATIVVADSTLTQGETSLVSITFSEAVNGFTNADLTVASGTLSAVSSSDGGITWTATLTPTANVTDTTNVITLANTGVTDQAGNAGSGNTNSGNYSVDTVRPSATIVIADNSLTVGETSLVTITFSQAVSGFSNADLNVANGALSTVSSADGGITWTATFTPNTAIQDSSNLIILDNTGVQAASSGNTGIGTTLSNNYAIDTQRPTATLVVADTALAIGQTSLVTITFSEAVSGFTNADLTVANGALSAVSSSDGGITWTATFTPSASISDTTNIITLDNTGVSDTAGNAGTGTTDSNNYAIDTLRPTATIVLADSTLNVGETSQVTITFSEAVSGFTNADLTVANGALSAVSSSDGGITWTATFTPNLNVQDVTNVITLSNNGVADLAGNAGTGTTSSGNYVINTIAPTATLVVADASLSIGETSLVTITFSEAVTGFSNADLTVANGTLTAVASSDGGITWTATLTPTANFTDASNLISLNNSGVQNTSGNPGFGTSDSNNYAIDTQRPTATLVVADTALGIGQSSLVTITFSERVSGFTGADLTVGNGTLSNITSSDGGTTWTATLVPAAGVTASANLITLDNTGITDLAGNTGTGTTSSNVYAVDSQRPTATLVLADTDLRPGETSLVTITFSEAVTGFDNSDLAVPNGSLSAVSSSDGGITWTAIFTPAQGVTDVANHLALNAAGISDLAGNLGTGTIDSSNFQVQTEVPTATIVIADAALKAGETSAVTITFSEAVSGFDNSDLNVANGTLSTVTSSDGGITWTATLTPTAAITASSNVISLDNSGVINTTGNAGVGTTVSNNYALDTQPPSATIVIADAALGVGQTSLVTITFSEAVSGFDNSDLSVDNATLSTVTSSDGGVTWTATLTPLAGITATRNSVRLDNAGVQDLSGNLGSGTTLSNNYAVDGQRPTATIALSDTALRAGETAQVTITFSEAVSGFDNSDLSVGNGTLSTVSSSDGGITWTASFTPAAGVTAETNLVRLDTAGVADLAGNAGVGTTDSANYAVQTQVPTAIIVVADSTLKAGDSSLVTITFSEAVSGFDNSDLRVGNGALSAVSSGDGGVSWTATFTPAANVTSTASLISLDNSRVTNASGNTGVGVTASNAYAIDTARPTATIVVANPRLGIDQTSAVTIAFSEPVTGFELADLNVANGTLANLASSDGGKTWTATLTPASNVSNANNAISLDTAGVTDAAGNAGSGTSQSNGYAIDTVVTPPVTPPTTVVVSPDPQFRVSAPVIVIEQPHLPLQPAVFAPPTGTLGSPLTFAPLFEERVLGDGVRPLGDIFINHGALSPSFIAQVFSSSDAGGDGAGHGFLGFGGGDGGVFSTSTFSGLFNQGTGAERASLDRFGNHSIGGTDVSQGARGIFGTPTLGQQLQQLKDTEQQQVDSLAAALQQVGSSEMQA